MAQKSILSSLIFTQYRFPHLIIIVFEMATQSSVSYAVCIVADLAVNMEGILNAVVLYRHDMRIKREMNTMISDFLKITGLGTFLKPSISPFPSTSPQEMNRNAALDQDLPPNIEMGALNLDRVIASTVAQDATTVKM